MMPPAQQAYAYNPLYAGQMGYAMPPGYPGYAGYNATHNQNSMEELVQGFANLKPMVGVPGSSYGPGAGIPPVFYRLNDGTLLHRPTAHQSRPTSFMPTTMQNAPSTPGHFAWNGMSQEHAEVPGLARRNSCSSNEEVGPQTPFFAGQLPDRKSTRLNSSHSGESRMPSSA